MKTWNRVLLKLHRLAPQIIWNRVATLFKIGSTGYDSETVIQMILQKNANWERVYETSVTSFENQKVITAIAHHLSNFNSATINVMDFGGGGGHSFRIARLTFKKLLIKWVVIERKKIVKKLQEEIRHEGLFFTSQIEDAKLLIGNIDLIFCNSALQYTDSPIKSLESILQQNAKTFFVTRTPFSRNKNTITYIQPSLSESNGPGPTPINLPSVLEGYICQVVPLEEAINLVKKYYNEVKVFDEGRWGEARSTKLINSYTILGSSPISS